MEPQQPGTAEISLSVYTTSLIKNFKAIPSKPVPDETTRLTVSQTASFFAIAYEKLRNAVEYKEAHLIRRGAIERILKRRLSLNPSGDGEGENLLRELLWARYFSQEAIGTYDIAVVQAVIDKYLVLIKSIGSKHSQQLLDLMTCEIEEMLTPKQSRQRALFSFYIFQVLKEKVKIENVESEKKDAYFYVALERAFNKSDLPYLRFHLFSLLHEPISGVSEQDLPKLIPVLPEVFAHIEEIINNPYSDRLTRYVRKQIPPFKILFSLFKKHERELPQVVQNKDSLWAAVEKLSREKYDQARSRLRTLATRAIIYIFLTKMLFALILEYPVSLWLYNEVNYTALAINSLFPPFLMFLIVSMTRIPGPDNTRRMFSRIIDIVDADRSFETTISYITRKPRAKKPVLIFTFTVFYSFTFILTFFLLYVVLSLLHFTFVSKAIFVFFVSIVSFFAIRIRQVAREYQLKEKEGILNPFADLFFMPFLSVGKFLSTGLSKLNVLGFMLDVLIEAPFKLLVEVVEEWINFVRARREEII